MVELDERVYNFIKVQGPVVPMQVAKHIESDSFLASAVLSGLLNNKKLKMSTAALGSSRLYYIPGQEKAVGDLLYPHLKSREKDAFNLLKDKQVLKDTELEPWCRVALRDLKDFAVGLVVETKNGKEGFWKYYLVDDQTAHDSIANNWMNQAVEEPVSLNQVQVTETKSEPMIESEFEVEQEQVEEEIVVEPVKKDTLTSYTETKKPGLEGTFYKKVKSYFEKNSITVLDEFLIKKNKEYGFVVKIPSNIGTLLFYVYSKDKASISDNDVAVAYAEAQRKNMNCLLLTTGKLNKKGEESVNKKFFGSVIFRQLK